MINKRRAKLKKGGARKMQMGGDYMEPSKEVKFGGPSKPMKYSPGGEKKEGDKTYTRAVALPEGATSNYKGEVFDKDGNKIGKRVSGSTPKYVPNERNAGSRSKEAADYINRSRGRTKAQIAKDESNAEMAKEADRRMAELKEKRDKEATAKAAEKRGPSREEKQNTPQGTSQNNKAKGQSPASKPKTPAKKPVTSTPPKAAPAAMERRKATSVPMRTSAQIEAAKPKPASATKVMLSGMSQKGTTAGKAQAEARFAGATRATKSATGAAATQKSTTKNTAADSPKSKRTARIDRRTERVTNRKENAASRPTRMDRKAARMNKRADRVEARKEKKADVNAAKARLKAARRLQSGGMKTPTEDQKGLKKLPTSVRNKMGYKKYGGKK